MASIKTNIGEVTEDMTEKIKRLVDKEYIPRILSFDLIDQMTNRIHNEGVAADGGPIGSYSEGYLKLRREKFKRSADTKIIVSLTRQLENNWSVIATDAGYGIGFLNPFNLQKARWVEENKDRLIFSLSPKEQDYVNETVSTLTYDALK